MRHWGGLGGLHRCRSGREYTTAGVPLQVCPLCFNARRLGDTALVAHAEIAGTVPLFDRIGGAAATDFSY